MSDNHWKEAADRLRLNTQATRRLVFTHGDITATRAALHLNVLPQGDTNLPMPQRTHVADFVHSTLADIGSRREWL